MRWFTKCVVVLLLALWVPVTMHCSLETLPGFSFLQSCCGADEAPQAASDCQEDSCGEVESGLYKIEDNPTDVAGLAAMITSAAWTWAAEPPTEPAPHFTPLPPAPPELPRSWQFFRRTALPPRAPALPA